MRNKLTREVNEKLQLVCWHRPTSDDPSSLSGRGKVSNPRARSSGDVGHIFCPALLIAFTNAIHTHKKRKKPPLCGVSPLHSLSLALPQIKISVIKLIKVMHANMPLGSKPDFIQHTVVESCRSFTFDVAFFIIENNWIPSPSPTPPHPPLSCMHKHTNRFFFSFILGLLC